MSYSINEAKNERQLDIQLARMTRDSEGLYHLANYEKEEGNDELAEALLAEARKIDREDEPEEVDNTFEVECHTAPAEGFDY